MQNCNLKAEVQRTHFVNEEHNLIYIYSFMITVKHTNYTICIQNKLN